MSQTGACIQLFDDIDRTDSSPSTHSEGLFQFLNRVDDEAFDKVRNLLEEWCANLPQTVRQEVREKFRSSDDRHTLGAFWELYVHEAYQRLGFLLEPHPDIPSTPRKPDWLVERNGEVFYMEASAATTSDVEEAANRRRNSFYDLINTVYTPDFGLWLDLDEEGPGNPPAGELRMQLEGWVNELDPDDIREQWDRTGYEGAPEFRWSESGWTIRVRAIPRTLEARGKPARPIGVYGPSQSRIIDNRTPLLKKLRKKASPYPDLDKPLILAVLHDQVFVEDIDVEEALFGQEVIEHSVFDDGTVIHRVKRRASGLWMGTAGPRYSRVSAVLVAMNLRPWNITSVRPQLWLNPWAAKTLAVPMPWVQAVFDPDHNEVEFSDARIQPADLFGLDEAWPGTPFQ